MPRVTASPATRARRGRGRPPGDTRASLDNPRFQRVWTATLLQEALYLAAVRRLDGRMPHAAVEAALRREIRELPPTGFKPAEVAALAARGAIVTVGGAAVKRADGPEKWAEQKTGELLGHGQRWYRDTLRQPFFEADGRPWKPPRRRRYSALARLQSEMGRHPTRFDRFTVNERTFLALPNAVQVAIKRSVSAARAGSKPIRDYFDRPLRERRGVCGSGETLVPAPLRRIVWNVIGPAHRKAARAICHRRLRGKASGWYVTPLPPFGRIR